MLAHKKILVIGDTHFPYSHPECIEFLAKLNKYYKPDTVVHIGDEADYHSQNFHGVDPDLPSAFDELEVTKSWIKRLEKIFPKMTLLESNHGSLVLRRAVASKMSRRFIKPYNDILEVNKKWEWKDKHIIKTDKNTICFAHQFSKDIAKAVKETSMCCVQGHFHTLSEVKFVANDFALNWGISTGCLVNKDSLSMAYMKVNVAKPILSCALITDGIPAITPMVLKNNGSWDKNIYI
jgi:predicted phosphodiesterase